MVSFDQHIVLPPDTQSRVDTLLHQHDTFLALFNTSSTSLHNTISADSVKNFDRTLASMAETLDSTLTPGTVSTFLTTLDRMATTFDRAITYETPNHLERALKSIESTFANIDAITANVRDFTNVVAVLLVVLGVSVLINVVLVFYVRGKNGTIAALKDRSKKEI